MDGPEAHAVCTGRIALAEVADGAVELALNWHRRALAGETRSERRTGHKLASLVSDPAGLALALKFVDQVARPDDVGVAAKVLATLTAREADFLGGLDRLLLRLGARLAPLAPHVVVPLARRRLRQLVGHLVVDARDPGLSRHLERSRAAGLRLNLNLLGEAVLGEAEAESRAERTRRLLQRDDVGYVSVKVSALVSQISTWDTEGTVARVVDRLRPIYRAAAASDPPAFVNLDMEEYRDLHLTLECFERLLSEPEFLGLTAGIVLQAYLPDSMAALERLIRFTRERLDAGGAPLKIRLVKGANLAMEAVEADVHGWTQAPYPTKPDVDANYLRLVERALRPDAVGALRVGVASHNLFAVAAAHLLAKRRGTSDALDVEMLQGMAPAHARVVQADVGSVILYTPIVAPADFDVAVAYLVRRLEENAQPQNFLHALVGDDAHPLAAQAERFREAVSAVDETPTARRRQPERPPVTERFANTPDSDPALPETRAVAAEAVGRPPAGPASPLLGSAAEVDDVVARGRAAGAEWARRPADERARVLREAARRLEAARWDLVATMASEGGKTVEQADPEVSEAVDFARYYADRALDLEGSPHADGARFEPPTLTLVTPPWNFPVAIPIGGALAALAAGSAVVLKPAPGVERCSEVAAHALLAAGVPADVLQVVRTDEGDVGRRLVAHEGVDLVILTGAIETARRFAGWRSNRPGGPRVHAETSGKNALVITPAADLDLAAQDLVRSAFGHAGQKCSAASLGILVGSVATSARFRRQVADATRSLRVGWPSDLGAGMGPVIAPPEGKLLRALTRLEPGEEWLVEPRALDETGRLWSPGVKTGVRPGSFFHTTEVFGPVLGLMAAGTLDEAIGLQNGTDFGLTGGIHSLDADEVERWLEHVEVGNAYVNRVTTGAIVRRQPFGGWKASSVGPGAKAGGPNYVASLGIWHPDGRPRRLLEPLPRVRVRRVALTPLAPDPVDASWLDAAIGSDSAAWAEGLGEEVDESRLASESNVLRYRPAPLVVLRCEPGFRPAELARLLLAAELTATPVALSLAPGARASLAPLLASSGAGRALAVELKAIERDDFPTLDGVPAGTRVRVIGPDAGLHDQFAGTGVEVFAGPVLATGRRELLGLLREQSVSRTLHRFGHVPPDAR